MTTLDAFTSERQPLGYSDAYGLDCAVDVGFLRTFPPFPWVASSAGMFGLTPLDRMERNLAAIRDKATASDKLAAWRELTT